jgi:hypothetical protein
VALRGSNDDEAREGPGVRGSRTTSSWAPPARVQLRERVADDDVAIAAGIIERLGESGDELRIELFPDGPDRELAQRHGDADANRGPRSSQSLRDFG